MNDAFITLIKSTLKEESKSIDYYIELKDCDAVNT